MTDNVQWATPTSVQRHLIRPCPVCGGKIGTLLHDSGLPNVYPVVCCNSCGMVFADTPHPQSWYDEYYSRQGRYTAEWAEWNAERYVEQADRIEGLGVGLGASIADVGCGSGGLVSALRDLAFTFVTGIDPSKGQRLQDLKQCDLAILSHVLEHICDVQGAVRYLARVAKAVYVEVPDAARYLIDESSPWQQFNEEHINHFGLSQLQSVFMCAGFTMRACGESTCDPNKFPVVWAYFTRDGKSLRDKIVRYCDRSAQLMATVEAQVDAVEGQVICWGIGALARRLEKRLDGRCFGCVDAAARGTFCGFPIHDPGIWDSLKSDTQILVTTILHRDSVLRQIKELGLRNRVITLGE